MVSSIDELGYIYDAAKTLMNEREKDYEGSWRDEGLGSAVGALYKKGSQVKTMYENGRLIENLPRSKEDCLDLMNYSAMVFRFLHLKENGSEISP
ncbi:hypothetical protein LCGC14_0998730 [marine sediment metagenome]|uniref:Nucleotide modification associated domain-containing protein n=1 Tax=marine sediment metagenome TaxID=412755 RepID=A0A0F9QM68_9ZZZZ